MNKSKFSLIFLVILIVAVFPYKQVGAVNSLDSQQSSAIEYTFHVYVPLIHMVDPMNGSVPPPAIPTKRGVGTPINGDPLPPVQIPATMWFYDWTYSKANLDNPYYLPMSFHGEDMIPADYTGTILVFNEPDNDSQANITPAKAAPAYRALLEKHAAARLCVGGTTLINGLKWFKDFYTELTALNVPLPTCLHMHSYMEGGATVAYAREVITAVHDLNGATLLITEFGDTQARLENIQAIVAWFDETPWIEKYFIFTTQVGGNEWWWPSWWKRQMNLYNDGALTSIGEFYFSGFPASTPMTTVNARP